MANTNSFREISDKFDVSQSSAHRVIASILGVISRLSTRYIRWPNAPQKARSSGSFCHTSGGIHHIIGAIDGCHIKITRPQCHGDDYINRKGYFSILLQGICDENAKFIDVFVGPPGRVHDARLLRHSPIYVSRHTTFGDRWKLLGDSAYVCRDFPFVLTPKKDNGTLTALDKQRNTRLCRSRVIIENAFGRLKCRFRRIRDIQNVNLEIIVRIVIAACTLHNMLTEDLCVCDEHPDGCPRVNDTNDS